MAVKPSMRAARAAKPHPYLRTFLQSLLDYQQALSESLQTRAEAEAVRNTIIALVLKGCFLKLAQEKQILHIERLASFKDLMKLRRHKPRPTDQLDMWREDHLRVAVDSLLSDLDIDSRLLPYARLSMLFDKLNTARLELLDPDLLGVVYQALCSKSSRKKSGQYYTPPMVVTEVVTAMKLDPVNNPELRVLDPACGSGQFLLGVYRELKQKLQSSGIDAESAHRQVLEQHLYGFDSDPFAVALTKMNLFLMQRSEDPIRFHVHRIDSLCRQENELFFRLQKTEHPPELSGRFDAVVGNPPWGSKLSKEQKAIYRLEYLSAESGVNSFSLFIERALQLVKPGGQVGLLIPDAYLNIRAHRASRKLLLEQAQLQRIATCGELFDKVFAPSMILQFRRKPSSDDSTSSRFTAIHNLGSPRERSQTLDSAAFMKTPENIFNIHLQTGMSELLSRIAHNAAYLKGHATFGLGLVTGDNERLIASERLTEEHEPLIVGKDLSPYRIDFSNHWIRYDRNELQQACPREIFDVPAKLIYRFIGKRLTFALDEESRFTLNNANVLVPRLPGFRIGYLLALLNSPVLQFYYTFNFFTVKVLRGNLERLPLRYCPDERQRAIEARVRLLMQAQGPEREALIEEIDREVFDIYGISESEQIMMAEQLLDELGEARPKAKGKLPRLGRSHTTRQAEAQV